MNASRAEAAKNLLIVDCATDLNELPGARWIPSPKVRDSLAALKAFAQQPTMKDGHPLNSYFADAEHQVVSFNGPPKIDDGQQPVSASVEGLRLGFAAPDDRLTSLSVPGEDLFGQTDPSLSFDIEFSSEEPDQVTISLMGLDEDHQIYTIQKTVAFPARLLAELLSRRKATADEAEQWRMADEEE